MKTEKQLRRGSEIFGRMDGGIRSYRTPRRNHVIQARWHLSDHLADRTRSPDFRAFEAVVADVDVAEDGEEKGVVDADVIGDEALQQRDERGAQDSHDQQAGAEIGERAQLGEAESKNIGPHDGVEEADQNDAPHGDVAKGQHGVMTRQPATMAATPSTGPARNFCVMPAPQKRPTMAPPQ